MSNYIQVDIYQIIKERHNTPYNDSLDYTLKNITPKKVFSMMVTSPSDIPLVNDILCVNMKNDDGKFVNKKFKVVRRIISNNAYLKFNNENKNKSEDNNKEHLQDNSQNNCLNDLDDLDKVKYFLEVVPFYGNKLVTHGNNNWDEPDILCVDLI